MWIIRFWQHWVISGSAAWYHVLLYFGFRCRTLHGNGSFTIDDFACIHLLLEIRWWEASQYKARKWLFYDQNMETGLSHTSQNSRVGHVSTIIEHFNWSPSIQGQEQDQSIDSTVVPLKRMLCNPLWELQIMVPNIAGRRSGNMCPINDWTDMEKPCLWWSFSVIPFSMDEEIKKAVLSQIVNRMPQMNNVYTKGSSDYAWQIRKCLWRPVEGDKRKAGGLWHFRWNCNQNRLYDVAMWLHWNGGAAAPSQEMIGFILPGLHGVSIHCIDCAEYILHLSDNRRTSGGKPDQLDGRRCR